MAGEDSKATFTFAVDEDASGPANSAARALAELRDEVTQDTRALGEMKKALRTLKEGGQESTDQFTQLKAAVDTKSASIAVANKKYLELGGSFKKVKTGAEGYGDRMRRLIDQQKGAATRSNHELTEQLRTLTEEMGGSRVLRAMTSRIALMGAVTAATAAGIAMLVKYGIASAEARRGELLRLEGLTKLRNYWGIASGNAKEMQGSLDKVAGSTALGRDRLGEYQAQLYKMGLRGKNLEATLEAMAIKSVTQGEAQAQMFAGWAAGLNLTGGSVEKFANDVKARLGPLADKYLMQFDVQLAKFHENLSQLFADLDIEPLQRARQVLFDLFSKATPSGQALAAIMTGWTQMFADGISSVAPTFRNFIRGALLYTLKFTNAILALRLWIKQTFARVPGMRDMATAALAGKVAIELLSVAFAVLAGEVVIATWPFLLVVAALWGVYKIFSAIETLFNEDLSDLDWGKLGKDIWHGIIDGLWSGYKAINQAIADLGIAAWNTLKSALGIHSPSKLFAELGEAIPQGVTVGVRAETRDVNRAIADMVDPAALELPVRGGRGATPSIAPSQPDTDGGGGGSGAGTAGAARGGGATTVTIGTVTVTASGGGDAKSLAADFVRELETALEQASLSMGAA
jgi:hypothetical protein